MTVKHGLAILCAGVVLGWTGADAQNVINHNTPIVTNITGLQAKGIDIRLLPQPQIIAYYQDSTGKEEAFSFPCPLGQCTLDTTAEVGDLIELLNTANLSVTSLKKHVAQRVCSNFASRFPNGCTAP